MDYFIRSFSTAYHGPDNDSAVLICSFSLKWQLAKCKVEFLGLANTTENINSENTQPTKKPYLT